MIRQFFVPIVGSLLIAFGLSAVRGAERTAETDANNPPAIRVALYNHSSKPTNGCKNLKRVLASDLGFECTEVSPQEIRLRCLSGFDLLVMPGGSGSLQAKRLGQDGREKIKQFVGAGGGYLGICAGSYLATNHYSWSLGLLNAKVVDTDHWARGTGKVRLNLEPAGRQLFDYPADEFEVYYGQGPLLAPNDKPDLRPMESLASYETEIAKHGAPKGVMKGTTAIARGMFGSGRVICCSPHPESKSGPQEVVVAAARWAANRDDTEH